MNNSRFWHGIATQTKQYLVSDEVKCGYFIALGFGPQDFKKERIERLEKAAAVASASNNFTITPIVVNAMPKSSASKKKDGEP